MGGTAVALRGASGVFLTTASSAAQMIFMSTIVLSLKFIKSPFIS